MKSIDRELLKSYFAEPNTEGTWAYKLECFIGALPILLGFIMFLVGWSVDGSPWAGMLVGVLCMAPGFGIIFIGHRVRNWLNGKPPVKATDQQMDEWWSSEQAFLKGRALDATGVTISECVAEPLIGCLAQQGTLEAIKKTETSGEVHFTPVRARIVLLSENQLITYECIYDRFTGQIRAEQTKEYFYKDLVSVSTSGSDSIELTTVWGKTISLTWRPDDGGENALKCLRRMMREKKV